MTLKKGIKILDYFLGEKTKQLEGIQEEGTNTTKLPHKIKFD